jgi:transcriptional antiterminator NusG
MMQHRGPMMDKRVTTSAMLKLDRQSQEHSRRLLNLAMASEKYCLLYPNQSGWLCLKTMTGRELAVEKELAEYEIVSLVPTRKGPEYRRRGRLIPARDIPILIGYTLVKCVASASAMQGLATIEHVTGVLGGWEKPMRIGSDFINRFKDKATAGAYDYAVQGPVLKRGEKARVIEGPFASFSGEVISAPSDGIGDAVIELDIFRQKTPICLPVAILEKL